MYPSGAKVLGNNGGSAQHDTDKKQVDGQPDIVADGDGREIHRAVAPRHNGIDHTGTHLCQLGDHHRPGNGQKCAAFNEVGGKFLQWDVGISIVV